MCYNKHVVKIKFKKVNKMKREGISFAGSLILDHIKIINTLPNRSDLVKINAIEHNVGGCVCNTGIDAKCLDPNLKVDAFGVLGDDGDGEFIIKELQRYGIITDQIKKRGGTSFTDVYAETETGCRTFFQYGGADDLFCLDDVDVDKVTSKIFHLGYFLLMEKLDEEDAEYGCKGARLLANLQKAGCLTSIDTISENSDRFKKILIPALKHVDYLFINELEASRITDIPLEVVDNKIDQDAVKKVLAKLLDMGVSKRVIIHASCGAYGMDKNGEYAFESSRKLPKGFIVGTVGAGDAFCAGALVASYRELPLKDCLLYGNASAMMALTTASATGGVIEVEKAIEKYNQLPSLV